MEQQGLSSYRICLMHCRIDNEHLTTARILLVPPVECPSIVSHLAQVIQLQEANVILRTSDEVLIRRQSGLCNGPY